MRKLVYALVILTMAIINAEDSSAIPAFARKYKLSCMTCHNPFPKLKPYGNEFAANGFAIHDIEATRYYEETGDPLLKLIRDFPIAARLEAYVTANLDDKEQVDFGTPYLMKLLSGGEIFKNISYYFYFYFDERGEVAGVEDAFLIFNDLFGSGIDLTVGQFQVSDPLFKRELRLMLEDYKIYTVRPEFSDIDLTYDRGIMLTYGLDWGAKSWNTDLAVQVLNGNGLRNADDAHLFDKDSYKNVGLRLSQDIGGFLRIGGYAYWGKESLLISEESSTINEVVMLAPDATIDISEYLQINLQYLRRTDSYQDVESHCALAEAIVYPSGYDSRLYFAGLVNYIYMDKGAEEDFMRKYWSATAHAGYLITRNLRITAEVTGNFSNKDNEFPFFSLGFVTAF